MPRGYENSQELALVILILYIHIVYILILYIVIVYILILYSVFRSALTF